jgi:plasmid stabilization system protein ParE
MRLIVRPDAELDATEGFDWYEAHFAGLGHDFLEEISACIAAVHEGPLRYPKVLGEMRRALPHRFPYGVFFVVGDEVIEVLAIMCLWRDPQRLVERQ